MKRLLILFLATACSYPQTPVVQNIERISKPLILDARIIDEVKLNYSKQVKAFYTANNHRMVWTNSDSLTIAGDSLIETLISADEYGLIADDYHREAIERLLLLPVHERFAHLELLLTDGFIAFHHDLKYGRVEQKTRKRIKPDSIHLDESVFALNRLISGMPLKKAVTSQEPNHQQYHALKHALAQLMLQRSESDSAWLHQVKQLSINMERWRWQRLAMPSRYLRVNAPSFTLQVVENDSVVLESNVIVGKPGTPTPELESIIRSFTIYPYWHVPRSIVKEILPGIQKDTLYLIRNNFDVIGRDGQLVDISSIDWAAYDAATFPYILRQREGSENALGVIKFTFSNNYGVYLHDTNSKKLFSRERRALSHGCVRVQKAADLARYLVRNDDIVSPEDIDQYLLLQRKLDIRLIEPLPVYLQYFTCEQKDGKLVFYEDVYGRDAALIDVLYGKMIAL